jgi:phage head maturation protease
MTDVGLCTTLNGNPMRATFKDGIKMNAFANILDNRGDIRQFYSIPAT